MCCWCFGCLRVKEEVIAPMRSKRCCYGSKPLKETYAVRRWGRKRCAGCSYEGSRGLVVLRLRSCESSCEGEILCVVLLRESSSHSIVHAGRYWSDKEVCYLRTVKVTADVWDVIGHMLKLSNKVRVLNSGYLLYGCVKVLILILVRRHDAPSSWRVEMLKALPTFISKLVAG